LSGFVTSQEQVAKAIEVVKGVKGVTGIKNNMIVKGQ
jgi:osmotically-inducible protein OsmY